MNRKLVAVLLFSMLFFSFMPVYAQEAEEVTETVLAPAMNITLWIASAFAIFFVCSNRVLGALTRRSVSEDDVLFMFVWIVCIVIAAITFNVYFNA